MYGAHLDLHVLTHSFPTRRASDLGDRYRCARRGARARGRASWRVRGGAANVRRGAAWRCERRGRGTRCPSHPRRARSTGLSRPAMTTAITQAAAPILPIGDNQTLLWGLTAHAHIGSAPDRTPV